VAFYRDIPNGVSVQPGFRSTISFRSAQFTASSTKTYGQTALTINDYLPELLNVVVKPRTTVVIPPPQSSPSPTPTPGGGGGGNGGGGLTLPPEIPAPNTSGMINAAYRKLASASSSKNFPNMTGDAASANDGVIRTGNVTSGWHSALNSGQIEWWQVDLGTANNCWLSRSRFDLTKIR
jgi:hypothetical protein